MLITVMVTGVTLLLLGLFTLHLDNYFLKEEHFLALNDKNELKKNSIPSQCKYLFSLYTLFYSTQAIFKKATIFF